jgi:histidinol dehydrogenase
LILNKTSFLNTTKDTPALNEDLYPLVKDICDNVKHSGDAAIRSYNKQFDQVDTPQLEITADTIKQAYSRIDSELKNSLIQSYERIKAYQESIKWESKRGQEECYELYHPLDSVGIYVPGGKASYPSTVLMTATLAQVAGVNNIVVVTPPQQQGVSDVVLAACYITGITSVYQVGGAQSIAALTYGTETIPKVDKIVGPGNQFVAYAKKYLFGTVGIDQIAGPSEIALIIDDTADLEAITYDVFAQAEHDELARTFVISEDLAVLQKLEQKIAELLSTIERHDIVQASIDNNHYLIHVDNFDDACDVMNSIAPEHASIQTKNPEAYLNHVRHVGALFLGYYSPEVIGDYVAGPSHVLPTNQNARFANGLSVNDFLTRHSVINLSQQSFNQIQQSAQTIAHTEQLFNHEQSIKVRINKGES